MIREEEMNFLRRLLTPLNGFKRPFTPVTGVQLPVGTPNNKNKGLERNFGPFFLFLKSMPSAIPSRSEKKRGNLALVNHLPVSNIYHWFI